MFLIYITHKHITILFFKIPSLVPKDHFQSSTEILHYWSHHSIRHFLEWGDYCGFEVTNIFEIHIINFDFDVSRKKIFHWCYVTRSPLPIHRPARFSFNHLLTSVDQSVGAPSYMKMSLFKFSSLQNLRINWVLWFFGGIFVFINQVTQFVYINWKIHINEYNIYF